MFRNKKDINLRWSILITICFVFLCVAVYFTKNAGYSKDIILQKADNYYANGQSFFAAKYYNKAIELKADGADLYRKYGLSLSRLGNYDMAEKYLKISLEIDPESYDTYYALGSTLFQNASLLNDDDKFIQGAHYLEQAINISPEIEKAYLLIGLCYRSCGLQESARSWYRRALLSGNFSQAGFYNLIGHTFMEEGIYKEALSYYKRAVDKDKTFVAAYCNAGDMSLKTNDEESALSYYEKAIEIDPSYTVPYIKIAEFYFDNKKFDELIPWCKRALKINPDENKANYLLGMTYKEKGRRSAAINYFRSAVRSGNDDAVYELRKMGAEVS